MKFLFLSIAAFSFGCGATISNHNHTPEIFLVHEGNRDLRLEWSQPLTAPQTVVIATTGFSYVQKHSLDLWVKHGMPIADAAEYLGREPGRGYRHFVFFEGTAVSQPLSVLKNQLDAVIVEILTADRQPTSSARCNERTIFGVTRCSFHHRRLTPWEHRTYLPLHGGHNNLTISR